MSIDAPLPTIISPFWLTVKLVVPSIFPLLFNVPETSTVPPVISPSAVTVTEPPFAIVVVPPEIVPLFSSAPPFAISTVPPEIVPLFVASFVEISISALPEIVPELLNVEPACASTVPPVIWPSAVTVTEPPFAIVVVPPEIVPLFSSAPPFAISTVPPEIVPLFVASPVEISISALSDIIPALSKVAPLATVVVPPVTCPPCSIVIELPELIEFVPPETRPPLLTVNEEPLLKVLSPPDILPPLVTSNLPLSNLFVPPLIEPLLPTLNVPFVTLATVVPLIEEPFCRVNRLSAPVILSFPADAVNLPLLFRL